MGILLEVLMAVGCISAAIAGSMWYSREEEKKDDSKRSA